MNVLIADDHDLVKDIIAAYLQSDGETSVDTASTLDGAIELIEKNGPYDVVLLDYTMPGMNGLDGMKRARAANGNKPVGLISGTADRAVAQDALTEGAAGFLPKTMPAGALIDAVRLMAAGEVFVHDSFMAQKPKVSDHELDRKLSKREKQVLEGLTQGLANKEIARKLGLQEVTVKLHVRTLCRKLQARNRTHAAMIAKETGFF